VRHGVGLVAVPSPQRVEPPDEPLASACQAQRKESSGKSQVLFFLEWF
jgi:hypothetical protein